MKNLLKLYNHQIIIRWEVARELPVENVSRRQIFQPKP